MNQLSEEFWNQRWEKGQTGWDIGYPSPAIVSYFEDVTDKQASILIPGCGNAYEAEALLNLGFKNITILDISEVAIQNLIQKFEFSGDVNVVHEDFFQHKGNYDYIVEQTFFCAIDPSLREAYAKKIHSLLLRNGILTGLLFNILFHNDGPPFGGKSNEYLPIFSPYFEILKFDFTDKSIPQRAGNEIYIELKKKLP